jgi:hypothetical protein
VRHLEYKGYNKELQEKVFHGSITSMNVTLIALVRQGGSWTIAHRLKALGMKLYGLIDNYTGRYRGKWFIVLA